MHSSTSFSGLSDVKNLYITGHSNGAIKFWDISCAIPFPIFSVEQQVLFIFQNVLKRRVLTLLEDCLENIFDGPHKRTGGVVVDYFLVGYI